MALRRSNSKARPARTEARSRTRQGPISHEELQQAISRYLQEGGRIEKLPEQKSVSSSLVGRHWSSSAVEIDPQG